MDWSLFARSLIIGLAIAAPVGPIGVLCIQRTLAHGRGPGLVTGLGAATADAWYAGVAAFGITVVSDLLLNERVWIRLFGGAFLCYLGLQTFLRSPAERTAAAPSRSMLRSYSSALVLTLTNPLTILSFAAIFSGLGSVTTGRGYGSAALMVLGVFLGSTAWWIILSSGLALLSTRVAMLTAGPGPLRWVNRVSGVVLLGFGLLAFVSLG